MGRRGPAPTPTPILKLRGSRLVTKRRGRREMSSLDGTPTCPEWLDDEAKAAWRWLIPMLKASRVLARMDRLALSRYCQHWSRWKKAELFIQKHGEAFPLKDEEGRIKCLQQFPQVAIAHKLSLAMTRLEQEFGLTPSARTRIQVPLTSVMTRNPALDEFFGPSKGAGAMAG